VASIVRPLQMPGPPALEVLQLRRPRLSGLCTLFVAQPYSTPNANSRPSRRLSHVTFTFSIKPETFNSYIGSSRLDLRWLQVRVLPQALAVSNSIRLTFLVLSLFGLAANLLGLAYTFAALVNVFFG